MAATGYNISFNPDTLHGAAKTWGKDQKPPLNVSQVTCLALTEFFERRGVSLDAAVPTAEAELQIEVRELSRAVGVAAVKAKLAELSVATADTAGGGR